MNKLTEEEWPNTFRFTDDLNSISDGGEFESSYFNIYPEKLRLGKENTVKNETSFLELDIKIMDGKFHFNYKCIFFNSLKSTNNIGCYCYADKIVMLAFCKYIRNELKNKDK